MKRGESHLEMRSAEGALWIPDLYISNMKTFTNTGFVDHPGIKMDVDKYKTIYYSRFVQELSTLSSVRKCHSCAGWLSTSQTKGCPSCAKVVITVAPGFEYSAATGSGTLKQS